MARTTTRGRRARRAGPSLKFDQKLVLNQWMLSVFEVSKFEELAESLKPPEHEGFSEDNVSYFCGVLQARFFEREELSRDTLLRYDENIVRYWTRITEKRNLEGNFLKLKYFQYLCLLFTEIYLERYFLNPRKLLSDLNNQVSIYNTDKDERDRIEFYESEDLNKIAFWSATGSGKTLLMHINILQYMHYLKQNGQARDVNRIILLTPNEGLSRQHLEEFSLSGIQAELFSKDSRGLFSGRSVEVIDIHKLREESGEKTIAIEAFEGNNLVLVDEGHRGASSAEVGHWMKMRNQLCENGFSFEYSATFGQAIKASKSRELEQEYAKCILFDYSYKYFYGDGYGKEYRILNLEDDSDEEFRRHYLIACLLAFYQQKKLFSEGKSVFRAFLIEQPLWVFVGGKVTAVRKHSGREVSDVVDILLFLAEFVRNRSYSVQYLDSLLRGASGLLDAKGNDIFASAFSFLMKQRVAADAVFEDILRVVFNASSTAAFHVENLKGTDGELALRLGDNEPFGLINVGDAPKLRDLCQNHRELVVEDRDFSGSYFHELDESDSKINILIGSKKFTEGWNSWRVSTMGLMNIGRSEGPQIIQLFGRGVRLKGKDFCLKRSKRVRGMSPPPDIDFIETLNIFGIRADYMRQFKEYLEEEGLPSNEDKIEFVLPVVKDLGSSKLKTIQLKEGVDFKQHGPKPAIDAPNERLKKNKLVLDWYPKIQALESKGMKALEVGERHEGKLSSEHVAFMDLDSVFFELQRFKNERAWFNLNLSKPKMESLLLQPDWYQLYIPKEELEFRSFDQVKRWQEIATVLLKKYCDRYYKFKKAEFENEHLEYRDLTPDDSNFFDEYLFLIEQSKEEIVAKLEELQELINSGELRDHEFQRMNFIRFANHLYYPLVYVANNLVEVKPITLENESERDFVVDLKSYCEQNSNQFRNRELYLLRNLSRGRGIGFFEAGNFHPDFIMWLLKDDKQYITFVDPKGIRNCDGMTDPKIRFSKTIKELEESLGDPGVILNSLIISSTPYLAVSHWNGGTTKNEFEENNVLFQKDDCGVYIGKLLMRLLAG